MNVAELPPLGTAPALAFADKAGARAWLADQPQADPVPMLHALDGQLRALAAADLPAEQALPLVSVLRLAAVPILLEVDQRFIRKALPLPPADQEIFSASQSVWQALAQADLRRAACLEGVAAAPGVLRAAMAVRHALYACFLAAQAIPPSLEHLLLATLQCAHDARVLDHVLRDPDFADLGDQTIAGELIWAVLLRVLDPYHWSAPQLSVANRAIRRWRTLLRFQALPADDPKAVQISLARLFPDREIASLPGWIDVRPLLRKIRQRQEALTAGESPEALKLGNELSAAACQRLLSDMALGLRQMPLRRSLENRRAAFCFGGEHAYAFFLNRYLNKTAAEVKAAAVAHQRMEIFGFDEMSRLPGQQLQVEIPSETWEIVDGVARRPLNAGARRLSPALLAGRDGEGQKRLGVLHALVADDVQLVGRVVWFAGTVAASYIEGIVKHGMPIPKYPVFLIRNDQDQMLIAPPNAGLAPGAKVKFADGELAPVILQEVRERGADFVGFACQPI